MDHNDLYELGLSHLQSFRRSGIVNDITKAAEYFADAVALTPDGHPDLPKRHANLGVSYEDRYRRLGQIGDLNKSTEHKSRALTLTPNGHPSLPGRHATLGVSYGDRYKRLDQLEDLNTSIEHKSRALTLTPDGHLDLPKRHATLGVSYSDRYQRLNQIDDLEKAIEHESCAVALTPAGHPDLPMRHGNLGMSYRDRYKRLGHLQDLDNSTEHKFRALELTPNGHPSLLKRHVDLGTSYSDRYKRMGQVEDLEKAIEHDSCALALTPAGHPDLPKRHMNLGVSYSYRYQRLGLVEALDKSLEHKSCALALTPEGHLHFPKLLSSLGVSYNYRYRRLGQLEDLDKSTEHKSRALALTPDGHPDLPIRHAAVGVSYSDRYRRLGQLEDLEKSIEHDSCALALTPDGHLDLPDRYANLGVSYGDRYRRLRQVKDLDRWTEHNSRALALTPDGHPSLPDRHAALGASYSNRYQRLGQVEDLDKSAEHKSRALELTPIDHPDLPNRHLKLDQARAFHLQYQHTSDSSYLTHALLSFRSASQIFTGSPRVKFDNALQWANLASKHTSLCPIEAYQTTINLLPQFIWLGATTHQRYQDLSTAEGLAIKAAAAAILHSDYKLALEWLEHARCVAWNQTLMLRSPIDDLHSSHPDLATRLQTVAQQLHEAGSVPSASQIPLSDEVDPEQIGKQRRLLANEYQDLLVQARMLSGFEDFLQPMKADRLVRAARYGPIVVINCHQDRCDALLILPEQDHVQHLPLPNFTQNKAKTARFRLETSLRNKGVRERGCKVRPKPGHTDSIESVLLLLWTDLVKPVLGFLGYLDISANGLPHITWCPTGALSFLPLHAAGDYDQQGSRVFDYVVSSYAPTLTSLVAPAPRPSDRMLRVLAVGQEFTPGHSPLPGTADELESLKARTQDTAQYSQITNIQATTANVLDAMEEYDWVHLACHAHQNVGDPTKSGFFLQDGTLDLVTINRRSFKNKGLAYLSACQTATGDEKLPDEAIHLASGMLMAGYPSVIATLWSVKDSDAPFVADGVY